MSPRLRPAPALAGTVPLLLLLAPLTVWSEAPPPKPEPTPVELQRFIGQLSDECFQVREEASQRLLAAGLPALPYLERASESSDPEVRHRAWRIIDQWAAEGQIPALLFQLSSGTPPIRAGAAETLGKLEAKGQPALPGLIQAAEDCTDYVRCSAQEAVKKIQATLPIRVEVKVAHDAIDLDTPTMFRIELSNQGKDAVTQVQLTAIVPAQLTVTNTEGPLAGQRDGNKVVTEAVTIEANESRYCEIHVKPKVAGVGRLQVQITADGLPAPIIGEATTTVVPPPPAQPK